MRSGRSPIKIVVIDRFMSECRTVANLIGHSGGTVAVAAWDGALDRKRMNFASALQVLV